MLIHLNAYRMDANPFTKIYGKVRVADTLKELLVSLILIELHQNYHGYVVNVNANKLII